MAINTYRFDGDKTFGYYTERLVTRDANGILRELGRGDTIDLTDIQVAELRTSLTLSLSTDPPVIDTVKELMESVGAPTDRDLAAWSDSDQAWVPSPSDSLLLTLRGQAFPVGGWDVGGWYGAPSVASATGATPPNQTEATPLWVPPGGSKRIDQLAAEVVTGAAGAVGRLLAYRSVPGIHYPGALLADFGTVDASAVGVKVVDLTAAPFAFPDYGLYWLALRGEGTVGANWRRSANLGLTIRNISASVALSTGHAMGHHYTPAAIPDPFAPGIGTSTAYGRIVVRAA